jgi:hypothetical protein
MSLKLATPAVLLASLVAAACAPAAAQGPDRGEKPDYVDRCPPPRGGDPGTDGSGNAVLFFVANLDVTARVKCGKAQVISGKYLRRDSCADECRLGRFRCDHQHAATYSCGRSSDGASLRFDIFDNGD